MQGHLGQVTHSKAVVVVKCVGGEDRREKENWGKGGKRERKRVSEGKAMLGD